MAIKDVQPIHPRRRASYRDGKFTYYLLWLVTSDTQYDGPAAAIIAPGIPPPGSIFINGGKKAYLTGLDVDPRDNSDRHFEVQAEFTTDDIEDDNPLHQPPTYSWSYQEATEPYFIDESTNGADGKGVPVVNSVGDAFEQFMQRESGTLTITVGRNEANYDAASDDQYGHTVNKFPVTLDGTTYDTGTLKLSPISAVKSSKKVRTGETIVYYAKTYIFKARHEGWHDAPLDVGYNTSVGDKTKNNQSIVPIVDANGLPLKTPWPLNGAGKKKPNATDKPAVLDFQPYKSMDWTPFAFI